MSGFSAAWLALREPADHAARDAGLAQAAAALLIGKTPTRILDLGCGTGSNFRAFSPLVAAPQAWTLVDFDPRLLAAHFQLRLLDLAGFRPVLMQCVVCHADLAPGRNGFWTGSINLTLSGIISIYHICRDKCLIDLAI